MDGSVWSSKTTGTCNCEIIDYLIYVYFFSLQWFIVHVFLNYHNQAEFELSQGSTRNRLSVEDEYAFTLFYNYHMLIYSTYLFLKKHDLVNLCSIFDTILHHYTFILMVLFDNLKRIDLEGRRPRVRRYAHDLKKLIRIGHGKISLVILLILVFFIHHLLLQKVWPFRILTSQLWLYCRSRDTC